MRSSQIFHRTSVYEGKYAVKLSITELVKISRKWRRRYNGCLWKMQMWSDSWCSNRESSGSSFRFHPMNVKRVITISSCVDVHQNQLNVIVESVVNGSSLIGWIFTNLRFGKPSSQMTKTTFIHVFYSSPGALPLWLRLFKGRSSSSKLVKHASAEWLQWNIYLEETYYMRIIINIKYTQTRMPHINTVKLIQSKGLWHISHNPVFCKTAHGRHCYRF